MYVFSHVSVYLSIFEMRNRNFLFHGRIHERLAQPEMHLRCQSPRATGQSQALDSWGDPLPNESQCLSIYPAEFRHLLSFGQSTYQNLGGVYPLCTPTSLVSKFARVSISTRQLKQTRQHLNLALQMAPFSATSVDHFRHSPCCRKCD